ncbi:Autophagy- protein 18b [Dionaea muscipula]
MANRGLPSPYPILCASFNQDASYFAIGTRTGFKLFDVKTGRLCYQRDMGAFLVVEMRFSSNLIALVGAGEQPSLSPRRLCLYNTTSGTALRELNFLTSVLAVRLNKSRLIVILQEKTFIYDLNSLAILSTIDTVPNPKGICAFSHHLDSCFLALPASTKKGSVSVYNVTELQSHSEINAHHAPLAAMVLSSDGAYLATASEQGTKIRVHMILDGTKCCSFRRGTYPSTVFCLSFEPSIQLPDLLGATSSSGSLHVFLLGLAMGERSRRSSSLLGSIVPGSITGVLDPAHHHVLHNVVPEGVKSCAAIRKVDKVADPSAYETICFRATIPIIAYDGYFREYSLTMNDQNEPLWNLERELNLSAAVLKV